MTVIAAAPASPGDVTDVLLWSVSLALVVVLAMAWVFSAVARRILRHRARLPAATAIVISILATAAGLFVGGWIRPDAPLRSGVTLVFGLGASVLAIAAYSSIAAHFQRNERASTGELLHAGESEHLEFKSTARVNLHTGERDPKIEQVIVKTVCGFVNADGGTLLIGVDDSGTPVGLDPDFATLKSPDADRFELWLRDALANALGPNTSRAVAVGFEPVEIGDGAAVTVCRVDCLPSPQPVFVAVARHESEFWVRTGNSTRKLAVKEASDYIASRWPLGLGASIAAQLRAAVRFSEVR